MEIVFWALAGALAAVVLCRGKLAKFAPYPVAALLVSAFLSILVSVPESISDPQVLLWSWSDSFGAAFSFRLDGLARVLAILITFIGAGVFLYAARYMQSMARPQSFYLTLTIFTAAMIGLVFSDNMIGFFLFWEITSVCSFLLVGTKHQSLSARESARKALFVTVGGGLLLLVGFLMIATHGQSMGLSLSESLKFSSIDPSIVSSSVYPAIVFCMAAGIATKSAQVPFHFWLPAAMAGPTPVSSFLHSATMVKAGVFLLARLTPYLGAHEVWNTTFTTMGALTMVVGAILSASQRDIKKILAFSTITVLGILVMLFGIGTDIAIKAAVVFLVAHALYKASLFQIIGNIDYLTGNRDLKTLGSLARVMPLTAVAALLSALSMAGAPPLFGFFGKELAYLAKLQMDDGGLILLPLAILTNVLLVGLAISICYRPFWSKNAAVQTKLKKLPWLMSLVPLTFSIAGLFIGLFPGVFDKYLGSQMASAVSGHDLTMKLKLWHGVNFESLLVLGLSAITLLIGMLVAVKVKPMIAFLSELLAKLQKFGPNAIFDRVITDIPKLAHNFISKLQSGDLSKYITWTLGSGLIIIMLPLTWTMSKSQLMIRLDWLDTILFGIITLPALGTLAVKNQVTRLLLLGASGFGLVLAFAVFSALDLALTQLLVEALLLIFVILMFRSLLTKTPEQQEKRYLLPYIVAAGLSLSMALMMLFVISELPNDTKTFFLENSYINAFGRNIVNVILVDFRALDTFGEVVVVAIASLGCGSLLLGRSNKQSG